MYLTVCSLYYMCFIFIGLFDDDFIEERRAGLEEFINKYEQE